MVFMSFSAVEGERSGRGTMKQLYLIRHAKSSWAHPDLADFDRPLNKRGKMNAPLMAGRLFARAITPHRIVSSPAKRAKKTAQHMAKGTGFSKKDIIYENGLYFSEYQEVIAIIEKYISDIQVLFVVGHNSMITDLAESLTGEHFNNVPTCGVVGVEYSGKNNFENVLESGTLLFFDYPKNLTP